MGTKTLPQQGGGAGSSRPIPQQGLGAAEAVGMSHSELQAVRDTGGGGMAQPGVLSSSGSPSFAGKGGMLSAEGCTEVPGVPPYLYWVTAGLALAEQWNLTVLSSSTGCGSTDRFTRGGSADRDSP